MNKSNIAIIVFIVNMTIVTVVNSQSFPVEFKEAKTAAKKHQAKEYAKKEAETVESYIDDINVITLTLMGIEDARLVNEGKSAIEIAEKNARRSAFKARLAAEYAKNEEKKSPQEQTKEDAAEAEKYAQIAEGYLKE